MIGIPDDIVVTSETRFWLITTLTTYGRRDENLRSPLLARDIIRVEVTEAAYREAYSKTFDLAPDMTNPLEDNWWSSWTVWFEPFVGGATIRKSLCGRIYNWGDS